MHTQKNGDYRSSKKYSVPSSSQQKIRTYSLLLRQDLLVLVKRDAFDEAESNCSSKILVEEAYGGASNKWKKAGLIVVGVIANDIAAR